MSLLSTLAGALPTGSSESRSLSTPSLVAGNAVYYTLLALSLAVLVLPVVIVVAVSFTSTDYQTFPPQGFSLRWYEAFLQSQFFDAFFFVSLPIAIAVGVISTILGILAAYGVVRRDVPFENEVVMYFLLPLIFPPAIIALALMVVYNTGIISRLPAFLQIAGGHIVITIPYTFLTAMTALQSIDTELEEAARNLGANQFQAFRKVTLPLMRSGVVSGFLLAFILSFTDSVIALFLSGGNTTTLPVRIFLFLQFDSSPLVAATATVQILLVLVLVLLIGRLVGFKAVTADI
ncbi:ABC transporter permease [Halobellus sp. EA9]|uniref:ABC transporter permease n=1 Tax=Halobellus sp. EA9 TaxID=3421647 RepID=UPI003EC0CECB